jgi:hypothetical protein
MKLDYNKPYAVVYGSSPVKFEQNGRQYDRKGHIIQEIPQEEIESAKLDLVEQPMAIPTMELPVPPTPKPRGRPATKQNKGTK